jgi:hypothetical protein
LADPSADAIAKKQARKRFAKYVEMSEPSHHAAPATKLTVGTL